MQKGDLSFVFVVQGPRLQAQSLILADSLRRHHPNADLVAYLPGETLADVPVAVADFLTACGVSCRRLDAPDDQWQQPYPHGNKILALAQPRDTRWSMFLDTDMAVIGAIDPTDLPEPMQVSVVPEGIGSWGKDFGQWQAAYGFFHMEMPDERIRLLRGRKLSFPPYFNGGMVAINEADKVDGRGFGDLWRTTASEFDWQAKASNKRPWLDQITLPLTMQRYGFKHKIVDERSNCSISNDRKLDGLNPTILHYHRARFLRNWPGHEHLTDAVMDRAASIHHHDTAALLTSAGFLGDLETKE